MPQCDAGALRALPLGMPKDLEYFAPVPADDEPTMKIPRISMHDLVYGEGYAPVGPNKTTRDLRAPLPAPETLAISDGVPVEVQDLAAASTQPFVRSAA